MEKKIENRYNKRIVYNRYDESDKTIFVILIPGANGGSLKVENNNIVVRAKRPADLVLDALEVEEVIYIPFRDAKFFDCKDLAEKRLENGILKVAFKKLSGDDSVSHEL